MFIAYDIRVGPVYMDRVGVIQVGVVLWIYSAVHGQSHLQRGIRIRTSAGQCRGIRVIEGAQEGI